MHLTENRLQGQPSAGARRAIINRLAWAYSRTMYEKVRASLLAELRQAEADGDASVLLNQYRLKAASLAAKAGPGGGSKG